MAEATRPMELKVIVGPGCSLSLRDDIESKISSLMSRPWQLTACTRTDFADGEKLMQIMENVRGADVYIVQSTNPPADNQDMLLQMLQAAALANANSVTAVLPYMGGLRQDAKDRPRIPITAALHAQQIETAMVASPQRHVMIFHPHFTQVQGFFRIPTDLLYPTDFFIKVLSELTNNDYSNVVPVAPDAGAAKLALHYRKRLKTESYAVGDKRRTKTDTTEMHGILGDVKGKIAVAYDDLIDTAGSMKALVAKLFELGAEKVYAFATHGVLAGDAIQNLRDSGIDQVFITDSIRHEHGKLPAEFITVVHVGELFGEAIWRNNTQGSIHAIDGMFNLKTLKS